MMVTTTTAVAAAAAVLYPAAQISAFAPQIPPPRLHRASARTPIPLHLQDSNNNNNGNGNTGDNDEEEGLNVLDGSSNSSGNGSSRKRDMIKNWMASSSPSNPVQPIGVPEENLTENVVRPKFDQLFSGMPSMADILSSPPPEEAPKPKPTTTTTNAAADSLDLQGDDWFEAERQAIIQSYEQIRRDMLAQLKDEAQRGGEVPDNARAMMEDVLRQEMEQEIAETLEARAQEQLVEYERQQLDKIQDGGSSATSDSKKSSEKVQDLMSRSEAEYQRQEESRAELDAFLRYEAEAFRAAAENTNDIDDASNSDDNDNTNDANAIPEPPPGADLDQWALQQLQRMMATRNDADAANDDSLSSDVLDILEENVQDLEARLAQEADRIDGGSSPETMKEWQMYRAIAAQLSQNDALIGNAQIDTRSREERQAREDRILQVLDAWKGYVNKEEGIRQESGLARGPKLPFEWQEPGSSDENDDLANEPSSAAADETPASRTDARRKINRMSIEAMESLLLNSDPARREKLQTEIEYLKNVLQSNDYLDIPEEDAAVEATPESTEPVNIQDVLSPPPVTKPAAPVQPSTAVPPSPPMYANADENDTSSSSTPPATPFFEQKDDAVKQEEEDFTPKAPTPNTPFFQNDNQEHEEEKETFTGDSRLGTMEDQKLEAMFRRAGARTVEEQARIRKEYEQFQELEKSKRDATGLSSGAGEDGSADAVDAANLKYNVEDVVKDGDIDAEKILSTIGPRPKRGAKPKPATDTKDSAVDGEEVFSSMYRSVAAVGGGRYRDNPEEKAKQMASYADFVQQEEEMRESINDDADIPLDEGIVEEIKNAGDEIYAEQAMGIIGDRPTPKQTRIVDEATLSDRNYEEDDDDDSKDDLESKLSEDASDMPEWLRKEKEGSEITGAFLGDEVIQEESIDEYEEKQRQLAEYERRRAGDQPGFGIDINDALGRARENAEYADYKFDEGYQRTGGRNSGSWGVASFEARKSNLLDYVELDVVDVNSVVDLKNSVHSTGVSQYTPRINKPFKEFGAIFRLEGLLVDITGLQMQAWTKVAEQYGFTAPAEEDVERAAVIRAEVAVKEIFYWTEDFIESNNIARTHREKFNGVFEAWALENGYSKKEESPVASTTGLAIGQELFEDQPTAQKEKPVPLQSMSQSEGTSEVQQVEESLKAWLKTAEILELPAPSEEDIFTSMELSPDVAVTRVFRWSNIPVEVDVIVEVYDAIRSGRDYAGEDGLEDDEDSPKALDEDAMMELHFLAWSKLAETNGYEKPFPDEVAAAFVLNDAEVAVIDGFGWVTDEAQAKKLATEFHQLLDVYILEETGVSVRTGKSSDANTPENDTPQPERPGPPFEELFKVHMKAWTEAAEIHGLYPPEESEVQVAMNMNPEETIQRLLQWTNEPDEIEEGAETFIDELKKSADSILGKGFHEYVLPKSSTGPLNSGASASGSTASPTEEDLLRVSREAWTAVAKQKGFREPGTEEIEFSFTVGPVMAVLIAFEWTSDEGEADAIATLYREEMNRRLSQWQIAPQPSAEKQTTKPLVTVIPGAPTWVKSLLDVEMQCGIISHLEKHQVDILLQAAGLEELVGTDKRVSATNNYSRDTFQMLGAALRLDRRPDHCVVFDCSPHAAVAAHDVEMQSVSFVGAFPRYELLASDSTSTSFQDLTAMNIRRLFGERVYDQPLFEAQGTEPVQRRKTKTKFFYDDED